MLPRDPVLEALQTSLSPYSGVSWYDILERDATDKLIRNEPSVWSDEWTIRVVKKLKVCYDDSVCNDDNKDD